MNVLYVLGSFPKLSESFVLNEVYGLRKRGHNVAVFARQNPGETIFHDEFSDLNIPVHYAKRPGLTDIHELCTRRIINPTILGQCLYWASPTDHAGYLHLASQCIVFADSLDWEPDHIHSHFATRDKVVGSYAAAYLNISSTVTAHATEIFLDPDVAALEVLFKRMNRVMVPSESNRTYLHNLLDSHTPIDIVPATTRVSKFQPTQSVVPNRILTVARLVEKKGIIYAIDVVARLVDEFPNIEYNIVGSGERKDVLKDRVREQDVEENVNFLGNVSDKRLNRELDEAAVFVLPSIITSDGDRDVSPVAIKEAMAMETPCVTTSIAGIPEIITDSEDGLLVEPRDTKAMAAAISRLLNDNEYRSEMGYRARMKMEAKFSLDAVINALVTSFNNAIDDVDTV